MTLNADGSQMITGTGGDGRSVLWNLQTGNRIAVFSNGSDYSGPTHSVSFGKDGNKVLTASMYNPILWDAASQQSLSVFETGDQFNVSGDISKDGSKVVFGKRFHDALLFDAATGQLLRTIDTNNNGSFFTAFFT